MDTNVITNLSHKKAQKEVSHKNAQKTQERKIKNCHEGSKAQRHKKD